MPPPEAIWLATTPSICSSRAAEAPAHPAIVTDSGSLGYAALGALAPRLAGGIRPLHRTGGLDRAARGGRCLRRHARHRARWRVLHAGQYFFNSLLGV